MNDKQFSIAWSAALSEPDRDAYINDCNLISLFLLKDESTEVDPCLIEQLGRIWDVAHMSIKDFRSVTGLTQAAFAVRFCIPQRTIENWECGQRTPTDYVRLMLAQLLGLISK